MRKAALIFTELMRRVFAFDVLECDRCGGRMRIIAPLHPPEAIRKILDCLGLPVSAPPIAPALRGLDGDVFARALEVYCARRILFGTDSSFLPRGWNASILETQVEILQQLGCGAEDARAILGRNLERLTETI
jgi:hypothetical protein